MNEILLYSGVYDWTVSSLIEKMREFPDDSDITYRTNSGGGDVFAAQGWLSDMNKRKGKNIQAIEGNASSMVFFSALYMDSVTALETSKALVHRANMYIRNEEDRKMLSDTNETFKKMMRSKLNIAAFEERAKMTLDDFFNPGPNGDIRHEIWLSAEDMVSIGLVKQENVLKLTPELAASLPKEVFASFDNYREPIVEATITTIPKENLINTNIKMEKPEIDAAISAALNAEKARVDAWMVYADVDMVKVKAGIESGKDITAKEMGEFVLAVANKSNLDAIAQNSPGAVDAATELATKTAYEKELEEEETKLNASLNLK